MPKLPKKWPAPMAPNTSSAGRATSHVSAPCSRPDSKRATPATLRAMKPPMKNHSNAVMML
ncbi:MAG: hypothetical protein ACHQ7M_03465 [Chloroflexota bacterium]